MRKLAITSTRTELSRKLINSTFYIVIKLSASGHLSRKATSQDRDDFVSMAETYRHLKTEVSPRVPSKITYNGYNWIVPFMFYLFAGSGAKESTQKSSFDLIILGS